MTKEQIQEKTKQLLEEYPRHFAQIIKRDNKLYKDILTITKSLPDESKLSERVYHIVYDENPYCVYGNKKKFRSINEGYKNCGRAAVCRCTKESVSKKVSTKKAMYSEEWKKEIQRKRTQTNVQKYGVENAGQTDKAKQRHKEFYLCTEKTKQSVDKNKQSKVKKHGKDNYNNRKKATETSLKKYGYKNPMMSESIAKKSADNRRKQLLEDPKKLVRKNYDAVKSKIKDELELDLLVTNEEYQGVADRPVWKFQCLHCDNTFEHRFDYANLPRCKYCYPGDISFKSVPELEILDFIKSIYNGVVISGDRSIINPYEVDILIPDKNIAIEYCGLFWHSELSSGKDYRYHERKMQLLQEKGIQLLTIFSDEYENDPNLVFRVLKNKLGVYDKKIGARKTTVHKVEKEIAQQFLEENHLQSFSKTTNIYYGLYHNNELLSLMGFKKKNTDTYELVRFCNSDVNVIGGASKLLKEFIREYQPKTIISFSDNRWSDGGLYEKLGFMKQSVVPPMQSYVESYKRRYHKLHFKKGKLINLGFDENKTEWQILKELRYDRIWDCGKKKWVKKC